jgi:hypothetical protein
MRYRRLANWVLFVPADDPAWDEDDLGWFYYDNVEHRGCVKLSKALRLARKFSKKYNIEVCVTKRKYWKSCKGDVPGYLARNGKMSWED